MHYKQYFGVGLCMEKIHLHLCNSLTHNYLNKKNVGKRKLNNNIAMGTLVHVFRYCIGMT